MVAVIAVGVAMMGCGSDGGDSDSLSKAEFVKQANESCREKRVDAVKRVTAYFKRHKSDGLSEAELSQRALRAGVVSTIEAEIAALNALQPPAEDAEEVDALVASLERTLTKAKGQAKTDEQVERSFIGVDKALRRYGLTQCTKSPNPELQSN